jgi:hypothetical protein
MEKIQIIKSSSENPNSIKKTRNIDFRGINDILCFFLNVFIMIFMDNMIKMDNEWIIYKEQNV